MKPKDKETLIRAIPIIIIVVLVNNLMQYGAIDSTYRLLYYITGGAIGGLIGHFLLKFMKKRKSSNRVKK